MPSATGSAPPERPVPAPRATNGNAVRVADPDDRLNLCGARGEHDECGNDAPARQPVALVGPQLLGLADRRGSCREPFDQLRRKPHLDKPKAS